MAEADHLYNEQPPYEETLVIYDQVIALFPEYAPALLGKGETLLALKRYQEGLDTFDRAKQVDIKVTSAHFHQSRAQALCSLQRKAIEMFEQAIRLDPRTLQYYDKKGEILLDLKRYEKALATYEQAIGLAPREMEAEYYKKKGMALLGLQRWEEALAAYEHCIEPGANDDPYCYHGKGQALFGLQRYEEALATYEEAIRLNAPDADPQFYHDEGLVYECLAQQAYQKETEASLRWKPTGRNNLPLIVSMRPEEFSLLHALAAHTSLVRSVALSPDGLTLASASEDLTIKFWEVQSGRLLRTLTEHTGGVNSVAFSPDGLSLASGSGDGTVKLWG